MASEVLSAKGYSAEVNVLAFDADPTGVADSTAAFAKAITECKKKDYSTLYVPAGTYKFAMTNTEPAFKIENVNGLCIRGDGALRSESQDGHFVGTKLVFVSESPVTGGKIGLYIDRCLCLRIENLTIYGAPATASTSLRSVGVRIDSSTSATGTSAIQFQNCAFLYCTTCVETSNSSNNSELSFYDCMFALSHTGFKPGAGQAVVNRFIGCVGSGGDATNTNMTTMFDLGSGGNVTVIGFGGGNMSTFVEVGPAGKNVGWNIFENVRLEARGVWGQDNRIKIYNAVLFETAEGGSQRTEFRGLVIVPPALGEDDNGIERFSLLAGHEVVVWNASRTAQPLATPTSKLLEFIGSPVAPEQQGGLFRCYNLDIPQDSRLDRDTVPAKGRYSFQDCHTDLVPYPDKLNPPLYGPNYLMKVESHCWAVGDALNGVNAAMSATGAAVVSVSPSDAFRAGVISCKTTGNGHAALISHDQAIEPGGATWRFQASARVTALPTSEGNEFSVRLGFGNSPSGEPAQGAYFRYRNEFNDNQWEGVLAWGANMSVVDLNITKNESWHTFEIEVDAAGGSARFYIDGVHRGTASAVITEAGPTALLPLQFVRTGGSGDKAAEIDYYKYEIRPTTVGAMYPE